MPAASLRRTVRPTRAGALSSVLVRTAFGLVTLLASAGCGGGNPPVAQAPEASLSPGGGDGHRLSPVAAGTADALSPYGDATWPAYAVSSRGGTLAVRATPNGPVTRTFGARLPSGAPYTFLLVDRRGDWLQVELPVRPNGTTGWVRARDARLAGLRYALEVSRSAHTLRLYDRQRLAATYAVAIGTRDTPTPGGLYYLIELLRPPTPGGPYGPFAYGLSGFSDVIHHFNGGDGVIGLHGTDQPASIGTDVSHGCIRLRNADITALARLLPLGTPVRIAA